MTAEVESIDTQTSNDEATKVVVADAPAPPVEESTKGVVVDVAVEEEKTEGGAVEEEKKKAEISKSSSFEEETSITSDLKEHEKKALIELKSKVEDAILTNKIFKKKEVEHKEKPKEEEKAVEGEKEPEKPVQEGGEKEKTPVKEEKSETPIVVTEEKVVEEAKTETPIEAVVEKAVEEVKTETPIEAVVEKAVEEVKSETPIEAPVEKIVEEAKIETPIEEKPEEVIVVDKDISIWGVPLLPSKGAVETDVVLLKFLRARDFKVNEALEMLKNTLQWRNAYNCDTILEEEMNPALNSVAYMDGVDREGHPICFNVYGAFQDNELYQKTFGTEEQRDHFLRWRVQLMERGIPKLDFTPGGVCSLLQINDLKNTPGPSKKELRLATKQAVGLLQDNYPEFVARNIFVNVPFWYYAFNALLAPFLTQRTKSKFVFARPASVTETLLKYIPANEIPVKYGGLKRENETEFSGEDVTELIVKAGATETVEIPAPEAGTTLVWDLTVLGWEVTYKEEFVPSDEGSYTIIIQKAKKLGFNEEPLRNSFRNSEPGKVVLTIENGSFKKKRILYRHKVEKSSS